MATRWAGGVVGLILGVGVSGGCGNHGGGVGAVKTGPARADSPVARGAAAAGKVEEPEIAAPSAENPVTVGAWVRPGVLKPGETAELVVRLRVAPGHHLYAVDATGAFTATAVRMEAGEVVRAAGDWVTPRAGADGYLTGVVEFRRAVRVDGRAAAGPGEVACAVTFQACTPELCWPPRTIEVRAGFVVAGVKTSG